MSTFAGSDSVLADLVYRATFLLLDNQYIVTSTLQNTYKCIAGSGIGLRTSAILASLYFYKVVESEMVPKMRAIGLKQWLRYHDDVLAHFSGRPSSSFCLAKLKKAAKGIWVIKVEDIASVGKTFDYLDLSVVVLLPSLVLSASQHKPVTPLCATSAHNVSIHASWPRAVAKRVYTLSCGDAGALRVLSNRYRQKATHPYTQAQFDTFSQFPSSLVSQPLKKNGSLESNQVRIPLVLRYHPLYKWVFHRALQIAPPPQEHGIVLRASWKNALRSMSGTVQKVSKETC